MNVNIVYNNISKRICTIIIEHNFSNICGLAAKDNIEKIV